MVKKQLRYELTTTRTEVDMPYAVSGKNKQSVLRSVRQKLRKGERILSLERSYFPKAVRKPTKKVNQYWW